MMVSRNGRTERQEGARNRKDGEGGPIRITGRARLTNARPPEEFAEQVRTNADFFATAFAEFNNRATIRFFERRGLELD